MHRPSHSHTSHTIKLGELCREACNAAGPQRFAPRLSTPSDLSTALSAQLPPVSGPASIGARVRPWHASVAYGRALACFSGPTTRHSLFAHPVIMVSGNLLLEIRQDVIKRWGLSSTFDRLSRYRLSFLRIREPSDECSRTVDCSTDNLFGKHPPIPSTETVRF